LTGLARSRSGHCPILEAMKRHGFRESVRPLEDRWTVRPLDRSRRVPKDRSRRVPECTDLRFVSTFHKHAVLSESAVVRRAGGGTSMKAASPGVELDGFLHRFISGG
jgi:hypothetical protein